jgi:V/A-type H+-transporting ATPase subunit D
MAQRDMGAEGVERYRHMAEYPLAGTTASLDAAFFTWQAAKEALRQWAEAEGALRRLAQAMQKARKRAAALGNVTIPAYEVRIKRIQSQLEERERDEQIRIRRVAAT